MTPLVLTLRFACEIAMVVAVVWWGWPVLGIVLGGLLVAFWAVLMAPRAARRLRDPARLLVELVLFAGAALAFAAVGQTTVAIVFAVVAVGAALYVRVRPGLGSEPWATR